MPLAYSHDVMPKHSDVLKDIDNRDHHRPLAGAESFVQRILLRRSGREMKSNSAARHSYRLPSYEVAKI